MENNSIFNEWVTVSYTKDKTNFCTTHTIICNLIIRGNDLLHYIYTYNYVCIRH